MTDPTNAPASNVAPVMTGNPQALPLIAEGEVGVQVYPDSRLMVRPTDDIQGIEQYRLLYARLLEAQRRMPLRRLLITSAFRGEGKTHVATNLACTMAAKSNNVLHVDGDMRKPDIHPAFGLQDLLRNGHCPKRPAQKVAGMKRCVLGSGRSHLQPLTALNILILKTFLDQISSAFHCVLIDYAEASEPAKVAKEKQKSQKKSGLKLG